jgi:hypothetical protein
MPLYSMFTARRLYLDEICDVQRKLLTERAGIEWLAGDGISRKPLGTACNDSIAFNAIRILRSKCPFSLSSVSEKGSYFKGVIFRDYKNYIVRRNFNSGKALRELKFQQGNELRQINVLAFMFVRKIRGAEYFFGIQFI